MNLRLTFAVAVALLGGTNSYAKGDFDNTDLPSGASVRFVGGCGTIVKFEKVTTLRPQYTDRRPDQGIIGGVGSGGDISQVLGVIPGVGAVAAIVGGAVTAIVANAAIDNANKQIDDESERTKHWEKVYLLGIKPDFGPEYSVVYEKINQKAPDIGSIVRVSSDAYAPSAGDRVKFIFLGSKELGEIGSEKYLTSCYSNYVNGKTGSLKFRHLAYNGQEFEWKKLPPEIQPSADAYFAKKAAEEAQKKADAAEAAKNDYR